MVVASTLVIAKSDVEFGYDIWEVDGAVMRDGVGSGVKKTEAMNAMGWPWRDGSGFEAGTLLVKWCGPLDILSSHDMLSLDVHL